MKKKHNAKIHLPALLLTLALAACIIGAGMLLPEWLLARERETILSAGEHLPADSLSPYRAQSLTLDKARLKALTPMLKVLWEQDTKAIDLYSFQFREPEDGELEYLEALRLFLQFSEKLSQTLEECGLEPPPLEATDEISLLCLQQQPELAVWVCMVGEVCMLLDSQTGAPLYLLFPLIATDETVEPAELWQSLCRMMTALFDGQAALESKDTGEKTILNDKQGSYRIRFSGGNDALLLELEIYSAAPVLNGNGQIFLSAREN